MQDIYLTSKLIAYIGGSDVKNNEPSVSSQHRSSQLAKLSRLLSVQGQAYLFRESVRLYIDEYEKFNQCSPRV